MKNKILFLGLILALIYGVISRTMWLSKSPPSLNWDEAAIGYNAYSLLETGRDEYGRFMPLTLRSFDDYKGAIYAYLTVPFIKILGLNQTAVRLPSALAGVGLIFLAYLLGKKIESEMTGVFAALAVALSGWGLIFSRTAFESNLGLFFLMLGIYLSIFSKKNIYNLLWGSFWLIISAYTYHSEKMVVPFILLWILIRYKKIFSKKIAVVYGLFLFFLGTPLIFTFFWGGGNLRFKGTSIAKLWPFKPEQSFLHPVSMPFYFLNESFGRILAPLSPANLFVRGSVGGAQQIYMAGIYPVSFMAVFVVGIFSFVKNFKKHFYLFVLLFVFGIVPVISWNWFSLVRSIPFVFMLSIIIGVGVSFVYKNLGRFKNLFLIIFLGFLMLEGIYNLNSAWMSVPAYFAGDYQDGMSDLVKGIQKNEAGFDRIIVDTNQAQAYIFMLFYGKFDPAEYQKLSLELSPEDLKEHTGFGKYEFRDLYWPIDQKLKNTLIVTSPINIGDEKIEQVHNEKIEIIDRMYNLFGEESMRFISVNSSN